MALATATLVLASCAEVDDTTGTRLNLPPTTSGTPSRKPADMGDVAIVG